MTKVEKHSWFLSLRWKMLLGVFLLITVLTLVLGSFASRELAGQQQFLLEEYRQVLQQNLSHSVSQVVDSAVAASQQLLLVVGDEFFEQELDFAQFDTQWQHMQLAWDVEAFGRISQPNYGGFYLGRLPGDDELKWFDRWSKASVPIWRIVCVDACLLQLQVPVLNNNVPFRIYLEEELALLINSFKSQQEFELAVLGGIGSTQNTTNYWGRTLFNISNREASLPVLDTVSNRWSWQELISREQLFEQGNELYAVWFFPLDTTESGPGILIFWKLNEWHLLLKSFQQNMLGLLLIILMLAGCVMAMVAWKPIRRLEWHTLTIPMIAQRQFYDVRLRLAPRKALLFDEVDLIAGAMLNLNDRLEALEQDVDDYTRELERLSMLDVLTGLPNKAMLIHELNKAIACIGRVHDKIALLFLDLDAFKRINDALGHNEGDELLKIVASRLNNCVRGMDTVFRQGGDEFLVLLRGIRDEQQVRRVIHKIFAALQQPVVLGNHKLIVTTSIGVAMCDSPSMNAEELIKFADLAMYQAKEAGRSNFRVFTDDMLHHANNRLMVEQDIGIAISERHLALFLQPIVALKDGQIKGFEALIRWFHPSRGLIMPSNFIPHIEESDAIIQVGNYVLAEAVDIIKRLRLQGWDDIYIAVNLSAKHYLTPGLGEYIRRLLAQAMVPPTSLLLEVTEESVIEQVDKALEVMRELKLLGLRIAIDDFGTGYSSLSYLKQLPFDVLKIDRCFTAGVLDNGADTHIVTTVIDLAHNLGRTVIAEGIENEMQSEFLDSAGCELAQGYLYSQPLPENQIVEILMAISSSRQWPKGADTLREIQRAQDKKEIKSLPNARVGTM